jgi:hypothetical protein
MAEHPVKVRSPFPVVAGEVPFLLIEVIADLYPVSKAFQVPDSFSELIR